MVSLHDIDADVILLDFWGSWCQPCRKSIPHLIELQSKLAGKRVQVIGIACEKAANAADRQASAAKAVEELGINYPVLLSSRDGSCPLQEALQIQFYPTMVLLSRDGRLLAREHGATDVTLPRMDRAIAMALCRAGKSTPATRACEPRGNRHCTSSTARTSWLWLFARLFFWVEVAVEIDPEHPRVLPDPRDQWRADDRCQQDQPKERPARQEQVQRSRSRARSAGWPSHSWRTWPP